MGGRAGDTHTLLTPQLVKWAEPGQNPRRATCTLAAWGEAPHLPEPAAVTIVTLAEEEPQAESM